MRKYLDELEHFVLYSGALERKNPKMYADLMAAIWADISKHAGDRN